MTQRKCEVCGHLWRSKYESEWILLCPKCKVSGYHAYHDPATTCSHCSGDMTLNTRCSHDGLCVSIEEFESRKVGTRK